MAKKNIRLDQQEGTDDSLLHDPLGQNADVNGSEEAEQELEAIIGAGEVRSAEESAVNTDTEVALEATNKTEETAEERALEDELAAIEPANKHKNRESTSEKAKKAAAVREKKGLDPEAPKKQLDPLRLRGKKYRQVVSLIDRSKEYSVEEAVELVKKTSISKFDASVEFHAHMKSDAVRGTLVLPHGTGKTKKVAVATDDTIEAIAAGKLDFDVLLATPAQMPKLAKYAKVLGPKGLMPSPKAGTVTDDIEKATAEIGGGRVEYRVDKTGVVHLAIGRVSFKNEALVENFRAVEQALGAGKVASISLASTMGPGVRVALAK